ncbi:MAG: hypothetical protein A3I38_00510 [Candidatus Wildermuthbacteria bacterium RIFCSPLOWO2_02_FULL_47_10]|nr:MAG: hypothetical protein UY15_C0020G0002 [Parcubacteria group bacterium GW2011_GWA2_47_9]OHA76170.1 MAG: hypothetical protein A3I38_00510 [Candidatus Wildermuthbacteria bacterium RIFCSPLOWO2_02_FULL_47_10]
MKLLKKGDKTIALIFDGKFEEGTHGLTGPELPLQIISLNYKKGRVWPLHIHKPLRRVTNRLLEPFFLLSGKVKFQIFLDSELFEEIHLVGGQGILLLEGAPRIEAEEDVVALEFKNGPYLEDKVILE